MRAVKLLAVLVILGAVAFAVSRMGGGGNEPTESQKKDRAEAKGGVAVEEKYGFTSQQAGQ